MKTIFILVICSIMESESINLKYIEWSLILFVVSNHIIAFIQVTVYKNPLKLVSH